MTTEELIGLWQDGQRRLALADPDFKPALERVVEAAVDELRRRLGGPFTTDELAALYLSQGIDWCFDVATRVAPHTPEAWDVATIGGAAFARYLREAGDWGGGRRIRARDEE